MSNPAVEVLAPAGGEESLAAAVRCGADAVYLGAQLFNARRGAQNFEDLAEAVRYCHIRGVRVYLTLNTLVFDEELSALIEVLRQACAAGVDAVIAQDLAVARLVRECAPKMPLHASTQMSIHDAHGARLLRELGFTRVVLARELAREEIAAVRDCGVELECFVHGALCMCVSGQCYLSAMIGGRSGNRGLCAQPCRLPFSSGGQDHALSLRDLSLIGSAGELAELGVASLKIEGRMKRPEYVAAAVTACRRVLAGETPDYAALEAVFSREGFTRGYYDGRLGRDMFGARRKEDVQSAAPVLKSLAALYREERPSVPVDFFFALREGMPAQLRAEDADGNAATVEGPLPQEARTAPTTPERAAAALGKTGGTPYAARRIESDIAPGIMLPASCLNALRRDALEALTALRGAPRAIPFAEVSATEEEPHRPEGEPWLRARLASATQLTEELAGLVREVIVPAEEFPRLRPELLERCRNKLMVEIPGVVFDRREDLNELLRGIKQSGIERAVVGGLGGIALAREHGFAPHGDYSLNIVNSLAAEEYRALGLQDATLSFELDFRRVRALRSGLPRGILAYGYLPLMTTRNCPVSQVPDPARCTRCENGAQELTDRMGKRFFVRCVWHVPHLYNCVPLDLADKREDLRGVDFLTLYFTRETPEDCAEIARRYGQGEAGEGDKTRGLYYRGVQ